jgi:hypothetical protein
MNITEELNNLQGELYKVSAVPVDRFTTIKQPEPVAYLRHEATHTNISVYKKIPKIQRFFIKWLFGLEYREI